MATIKDVAKAAQVSIGTVTNVINGKAVNEEITRKVEAAIVELDYTPKTAAQKLKSSKTSVVGVMLPDITSAFSHELLAIIMEYLKSAQYEASLQLTEGNTEKELAILQNFVSGRVSGIISVHPQLDAHTYYVKAKGLPLVFCGHMLPDRGDATTISLNYDKTLTEAADYLSSRGYTDIYLLSDDRIFPGTSITEYLIKHLEGTAKFHAVSASKEKIFSIFYRIFLKNSGKIGIISLCQTYIDVVREAAAMLGKQTDDTISIIAFKGESWCQYGEQLLPCIEYPGKKMGETVVSLLLKQIEAGKIWEPVRKDFSCSFRQLPKHTQHTGLDELTILALDSPAGYALESMRPFFLRMFGTSINVKLLPYEELYRTSFSALKAGRVDFDITMVDLTWLSEFSEMGGLLPITGFIESEHVTLPAFIDNLLDEYGSHHGTLYGLPFMPGTQILFFRKDIFDDREVRRNFRKTFNFELRPPKTWIEFNSIGKFFTRSFNSRSPVDFGLTMAAGATDCIVSEFCPRMWAYGGRDFDEKMNVVINSAEVLAAVKNYMNSFMYAPPESLSHLWDDEIKDFQSGNVAMMVLYDSHASHLNSAADAGYSIGYGTIPGGIPTLGGWSLAINRATPKPEKAFDFLVRMTSGEIAYPYTFLGGTTAIESFYTDRDIWSVYPWLPVSLFSYSLSRKRTSPFKGGPTLANENEYETIIGKELKEILTGSQTPAEGIARMEKRLRDLVKPLKK